MARRSNGPVLALLAIAVAASGTLLLILGSKLTFLLDDWTFIVYRPGFTEDSILAPHGEHIVVGPILVYKGLLATLGMESALPFRVVSTAMFLLSCVLLFVYLRRRIDAWLALLGTIVILFLGAAWEDLLWPFQIGFFTAMVGGLGALLALERRDRRGDALACLGLSLAMVFSSIGIPFAVGAAVEVLRSRDRWRRLYVVAVPLAIYALWWIGWGHTAESAASGENILSAPLFLLDGLAAALSSLLNLPSAFPGIGIEGMTWGRLLLGAGAILAVWRLARLGKVPEWLWVVGAIALAFWLLAGVNEKPGRDPSSSRYQYVGAIFVLLIAAELLRGVRFRWPWLAAIAAVVAVGVFGNIKVLDDAYQGYKLTSELERADLAAVEIARDTVEPAFVLSEDIADTGYVHVEAGAYFDAVDDFGSPAYTPEELATSPIRARFAADKVLYNALRIGLTPVPSSAVPAGPRLPGEVAENGLVPIPAGRCVRVTPADRGGPLLSLPPEGALLAAGSEPIADIRMTRFALNYYFPIDLGRGLAPGQAAEIRTPIDRATEPWKLELEAGGPATVCGLGRPVS